jgi:uncharacterized membrane protein
MSGLSPVGVKRKYALYLVFLNVAGILLSAQLTWNHFSGVNPSFCEYGSHVSCVSVQSSVWGFILGVPAAYFGLVYFVVGLGLAIYVASPRTDDADIAAGTLMHVVVGLVSVAYFVYGEYCLGVVCPMCTLVHLVIVVSLYFARKVQVLRFPTFSLSPLAVLRLAWALRIWLLVTVLFVGLPIIALHVMNAPEPSPYSQKQLQQLASCVSSRRMTLYVKADCPYCAKQKDMFGPAIEHLKVVECASFDDPNCPGVHVFPFWVKLPRSAYEDEFKKGGLISIQEISEISKCAIQPDEL